MTVDGVSPIVHDNNEQQTPETTLFDTLLDAAGAVSATNDSETTGNVSRQEIGYFLLHLTPIVVNSLLISSS